MIQEVTMYTVICDNCGTDCNRDEEFSCYNDKSCALDVAMESDWQQDRGKDYCPACWSHDENDNLVIDKSRTKPIKLAESLAEKEKRELWDRAVNSVELEQRVYTSDGNYESQVIGKEFNIGLDENEYLALTKPEYKP